MRNALSTIVAFEPTADHPSGIRPTLLNRLIDEMTTMMLVEHDAETRFRLRAANGAGKTARGLALLKKAGNK